VAHCGSGGLNDVLAQNFIASPSVARLPAPSVAVAGGLPYRPPRPGCVCPLPAAGSRPQRTPTARSAACSSRASTWRAVSAGSRPVGPATSGLHLTGQGAPRQYTPASHQLNTPVVGEVADFEATNARDSDRPLRPGWTKMSDARGGSGRNETGSCALDQYSSGPGEVSDRIGRWCTASQSSNRPATEN